MQTPLPRGASRCAGNAPGRPGRKRTRSLVPPGLHPLTCAPRSTMDKRSGNLRPGSCVHSFKVTQPLPEPQSRHLAPSQCFPGGPVRSRFTGGQKRNSDSNIDLTKSYRKMKCSKSHMKMSVPNRICFPFRRSRIVTCSFNKRPVTHHVPGTAHLTVNETWLASGLEQ